METNKWVASSQHLYRWLLHLYPKTYRTVYEAEMFHLFTDQCREAYKQRGRLGILFLWFRTLIDLGITVIREHLIDPHSKIGLLEAVPNEPLPWKGVLLVLIPGLIFFISQVEQVTSSNDWFFIASHRAGYFLILPVLLVWLLTRRFPVWGLIPLGLLYATLANYNPDYVLTRLGLYDPFDPDSQLIYTNPTSLGYFIAVSACIVLLCGLMGYHARQRQISRNAWKWLGLYGLLTLLRVAGEFYSFFQWNYHDDWSPLDVRNYLLQMPFWYLYESLPFLVLVFIGMFLARKHGGLIFLILLGYLLPTVVFGRYDTSYEITPFYLISLAVLIYRFIVALVAPIWLVRAASIPGRQRAAAIPVALAILCNMALHVIVALVWQATSNYEPNVLALVSVLWDQLIIASGLGLAVALYLPGKKDQTVVSPPAWVATTE